MTDKTTSHGSGGDPHTDAAAAIRYAAKVLNAAVVASVGVVCACLSLLWGEDRDVG